VAKISGLQMAMQSLVKYRSVGWRYRFTASQIYRVAALALALCGTSLSPLMFALGAHTPHAAQIVVLTIMAIACTLVMPLFVCLILGVGALVSLPWVWFAYLSRTWTTFLWFLLQASSPGALLLLLGVCYCGGRCSRGAAFA
jgi:hypothetical protein